jgi:hypothetical protein
MQTRQAGLEGTGRDPAPPARQAIGALVRFGQLSGASPVPDPSELTLLPAHDPESAADRLSVQTTKVLEGEARQTSGCRPPGWPDAEARDRDARQSTPTLYNTLSGEGHRPDQASLMAGDVIVPVVARPHTVHRLWSR